LEHCLSFIPSTTVAPSTVQSSSTPAENENAALKSRIAQLEKQLAEKDCENNFNNTGNNTGFIGVQYCARLRAQDANKIAALNKSVDMSARSIESLKLRIQSMTKTDE